MLLRSLAHTLLVGGTIASTVILGLFNNAITKDGLDHYAEKPWTFMSKVCPWILTCPMPANTFVNAGYFIIALYWLFWTRHAQTDSVITEHQAYMFYVFAWSCLFYAPIQVARIVTQNHHLAILDQWYTLPIFGWVTVWTSFLLEGWHPPTFVSIVTISSCSYCFSLMQMPGYEDKGFDVALAFHILFAVVYGAWLSGTHYSPRAVISFWMSILCCAGFVCLKLSDTNLAKVHPFFRVLSGHFWSKICDFMQIHFVFDFFQHITLTINSEGKKDL